MWKNERNASILCPTKGVESVKKSILIAIEGLDGSGKATQTQKICDYLGNLSIPYHKISFPDYNEKSSVPVQMYLKGEIGSLNEVNAYAASSFFAIDRYISFKRYWEKDYQNGTIIVADRYATSNIVHQMVKLPEKEYAAYIQWVEQYEYQLLQIPRPDLVIYLDMEPQVSRKLLSKRYHGNENEKDIHESNFTYLKNCRKAALFAAKQLGWHVVACSDSENPFSVDKIFEQIKIILDTEVL